MEPLQAAGRPQAILVKVGDNATLADWRACFRAVAPRFAIRWWDDPTVRPQDVAHVFVWSPPFGWLARFANRRVVFSSGAGVDHITADPVWPRHLPLMRMGGAGTAQRMGEYVAWACLTLLCEMPETMDLLDARTLALLPPGAGLVNMARGAHVVTTDLLSLLDSDHLAGAVLDVVEGEPLDPASRPWDHPELTLTPRIASMSSRPERAAYVAVAIVAHEAGQSLPNLYEPVRG